jgi:hypothetical protein
MTMSKLEWDAILGTALFPMSNRREHQHPYAVTFDPYAPLLFVFVHQLRIAGPRFLDTQSVVLRCQSLHLCLRHALNILLLAPFSVIHVTATTTLHMLIAMFKVCDGAHVSRRIHPSTKSPMLQPYLPLHTVLSEYIYLLVTSCNLFICSVDHGN